MQRAGAFAFAALAAFALPASVIGCGGTASSPTQPSSLQHSAVLSPPPSPGNPTWTTGTVTWKSIVATRQICPELSSQVGESWDVSLGVHRYGDSVSLLFAEGGPPDPADPFAEPPEKFVGTLKEGTIAATMEDPLFQMACPGDASLTPETGGVLTATVAGDRVSGTYTEVYGSGADAVTFKLAFEAGWPTSAARSR